MYLARILRAVVNASGAKCFLPLLAPNLLGLLACMNQSDFIPYEAPFMRAALNLPSELQYVTVARAGRGKL